MSGYPNEESGISTFKFEVRESSIDKLLVDPECIFDMTSTGTWSSSPRGITCTDSRD